MPNVFGLDEATTDPDPFASDDEEEETPVEEPETPEVEEEEAPESPVESSEEVEEVEEATETEEEASEEDPDSAVAADDSGPTTEQPPPDAEPLYLGRYKTPEEVVEAYQQVRTLQQRTGEAKNQIEAENQQLRSLLQQAAVALQAAQPKVPALDPELLKQAEEAGMDEEQLAVAQRIAEQAAQQRLGPVQQQLESDRSQMQHQQLAAQNVATVQGFRAAHPDITPGSEMDLAIATTFTEFQNDPMIQLQLTPETLEIAYEAARDPYFARELKINPALIDTDEGLEKARFEATLRRTAEGATQAQTKTASTQARQAAAAAATVETGGSGAPATSPDGTPLDEWDAAVALAANEKKSAFF